MTHSPHVSDSNHCLVACTSGHPLHLTPRRLPYERDLISYMEGLIRDMDMKIKKNKERAAAESRPKALKPDDAARLEAIKAQQSGALVLHHWQ